MEGDIALQILLSRHPGRVASRDLGAVSRALLNWVPDNAFGISGMTATASEYGVDSTDYAANLSKMNEKMRIREASISDAQAIARVHMCSREEAMPWLPVVHTREEVEVYFEEVVLKKQAVWVAELSNEIAGFVAFSDDWIHHLYVAPKHWRRGVGAQLLTRVLDASTFLQLWTFQENRRARTFYLKCGFEEIEFTDGAMNEEKTPDVRLSWRRA